jgi:hypothetical protein
MAALVLASAFSTTSVSATTTPSSLANHVYGRARRIHRASPSGTGQTTAIGRPSDRLVTQGFLAAKEAAVDLATPAPRVTFSNVRRGQGERSREGQASSRSTLAGGR